MNIFFTSDEHYGHKNILTYCNRPFSSTDEMREVFIKNHNAVVKSEDEVWHLGDFTFKNSHPQDGVEAILTRLNGKHRLIIGNHDNCWPKHKQATQQLYNYYKAGFYEVTQIKRQNFPGLGEVLLTHLPIVSLSYDDRYQEFAPTATVYEDLKIDWIIHGHVHGHWKIKDRMINVGVDAWNYCPVPLEELTLK